MIAEVTGALFVIGLLFAGIVRPTHAECRPGWYLGEGIRRSGNFACYSPLERSCCDTRESCVKECAPQTIERDAIYCTGGSIPVVINERTVGCQARH